MGEPKFSTWIVAMIIVSGVVALSGLFMAELSVNYDQTYNVNESPEIFNKLNDLNNETEKYRQDLLTSEEDAPKTIIGRTVDVLGDLFNSGYIAMKTVGGSLSVFESMATTGFNKLGLGKAGNIIQTVIISSVIVIITVGIIITVLVRRQV